MLRIHRDQQRTLGEDAAVAVALAFVAGSVNASGLLAAGAMTSHMTGNLTRVGEGLALHASEAFAPASYIACFLLGAIAAALALRVVQHRGREPVPAMLLVEASLLVALSLAARNADRAPLVTQALCFAMGWQNAIITRVSGAVVRTTHVTGVITDFGIELANLVGEKSAEHRHRAILHGTILVTFFAGAVVGPALCVHFGYRALLLPACVLCGFVTLDYFRRNLLPTRAS